MTARDEIEKLCESCGKVKNLQLKFHIAIASVVVIGLPFFSWMAIAIINIDKKVDTGNALFNRAVPRIESRIYDLENRERTNTTSMEKTYKNIEELLEKMKK